MILYTSGPITWVMRIFIEYAIFLVEDDGWNMSLRGLVGCDNVALRLRDC